MEIQARDVESLNQHHGSGVTGPGESGWRVEACLRGGIGAYLDEDRWIRISQEF